MKFLKSHFPILLFVLFELVVGILLLVAPAQFTKAALIAFGAVLIVVGAIYLLRFFRRKKAEGPDYVLLALSVAAMIAGVVIECTSGLIMGLLAAVAIIYGVILIVSGAFKIKTYLDFRKLGVRFPLIMFVSAMISIFLGLVIAFNPFMLVEIMYVFCGISLILEAFVDAVALSLNLGGESLISGHAGSGEAEEAGQTEENREKED